MQTQLLYLFTRTPLHVGAGASVGAIDQPIQRERHTGFPIIPASSLKGTFADAWNDCLKDEEADKDRKVNRVRVTNKGENSEAAWLFGSDNDKHAAAGSLLFSEARVLAFPIRSAKGSYAWITCPLMLQRAARDGVFGPASTSETPNAVRDFIDSLDEPSDNEARYAGSTLDLSGKIVLEEYCFTQTKLNNAPEPLPAGLATALAELVEDALFATITDRLVILSNGMMSHFVSTTCEIAQHVRINDDSGTADEGGLFNQENVPADTLFYSVLKAMKSRVPGDSFKDDPKTEPGTKALAAFKSKVESHKVFQFGGDASTGLGFCTVTLNSQKGA
jgi:CRISPR-associated protein Cmr4